MDGWMEGGGLKKEEGNMDGTGERERRVGGHTQRYDKEDQSVGRSGHHRFSVIVKLSHPGLEVHEQVQQH